MTTSPNDDWSAPSTSSLPSAQHLSRAFPIKDDWEDSDDEEDGPVLLDARPQRVLDTPPIIESPPSRGSLPIPANSIAAAAFKPTFTILKRPPSNPQPKRDSNEGKREDFNEREARYREARERIFGSGQGDGGGSKSGSSSSLDLSMKRQPKGPEEGEGKGFKARSRKKEKEQSPLPVPDATVSTTH
ncbi:hypothetical protein BDZ89DRAFT_1137347 [Hymenopellis radicata]|nr:hypothetical protein BDZ89DRAFT_1137347 [Hymenopellis radicata]